MSLQVLKFVRPTALVLALGFAVGAAQAQAQAPAPGQWGWVASAQAGFGGDSVDTLHYTNGKTTHMEAGRGIEGDVGGHYRLAGSPVDLVATVGYRVTIAGGSNGNPMIKRTTFALRADYMLADEFWVGAGPTFHTGVKYDSDGFGFDQKFNNATGLTAVVGWNMGFLSFTKMDYKNQYHQSYSADSIALGVIGRF